MAQVISPTGSWPVVIFSYGEVDSCRRLHVELSGSTILLMVRIFHAALLLLVASLSFSCKESSTEQSPINRDTPSTKASLASGDKIVFADVTTEAGLGAFHHQTGAFGMKWIPETMGSGAGFIDYNGDEWLDILLVGGGVWPDQSDAEVPALWLYRNNGDGTFVQVTEAVGLGGIQAYGMGITVADYDNDGDEDFYFTTLHRNRLFRNDNGQFAEVAKQAGVDGADEWSTCSVFLDTDRDGHLDLYVCGYLEWPPKKEVACHLGNERAYCPPENYKGLAGRYFHNNGNGTFSERTKEAGFLAFGGKSLGAVEVDVDKDGWLDLFVANDSERNFFYHNDGDGTFTEKGVRAGVAFDDRGSARGGMGIDVGDVQGNGHVSLFIGNFSEQMIGVFEQVQDGLFIDRAAGSRVGLPSYLTLTFGLFLFDVELDGDLDLFAANGHIQERIQVHHDNVTYRQAAQLFVNRGDGTFEEFRPEADSPIAQPFVARGAAYGDVDRDGDLDVLIVENGGGAHLWRNEHEDSQYLRVELEGRQSNRSGAGAHIAAFSGSERMERWIQTGGSYLSASEQVATFGLGRHQSVDSLHIHWPGGQLDRLTDLQGRQHVRIVEGRDAVVSVDSTNELPPS